MLWLLRCNAVASFDPFATGNYTENNNWLYHSGELDHRGHYPYDVFFIQPTLYILSIRETTGLVQIPFYIQGLSFPLNLSPTTLFYLTINLAGAGFIMLLFSFPQKFNTYYFIK